MERTHDADDERRPTDQEAGEGSELAMQVGEEVQHARSEVFRAYVRARERARELGDSEGLGGPRE